MNNNESNISPFRKEYPLLNSKRYQCSTDSRFNKIDEFGELDWFLTNNMSNKLQ